MENTPYPTTFAASNAHHIRHAPMPISFQQYAAPSQHLQQQQPYFGFMPLAGYPMYAFPTHNFPFIPVRQPFQQINQQYYAVPQSAPPQQQVFVDAPPSTPTTSRSFMHNTSLNASLGATSFNNNSIRFNPMGGRVRSRDHSLLIDQSTGSSDRSFQQSVIDPQAMAANKDLIEYCINELGRKQLTEQELVVKVTKARRFKNWRKEGIPTAISLILYTFPYFISKTYVVKTGSNDPNPSQRTVWKSDKRYLKPRGGKLNATMFEIPERSSGGEVLSVLGDIASLNLEENKPATSIASVEKVMDGIKV